jgi:hypothetical protein
MDLAHGQAFQHGANCGMGLGDQHRPHQTKGEALFANGIAASKLTEISGIIDEPQIELFRCSLLVQTNQPIDHLLEIFAALQEVGLHLIAEVLFDPFLLAQLIPALAQWSPQRFR